MICLHFYLNTGISSDVYIHSYLQRHRNMCTYTHSEPDHRLTNTLCNSHVHVYDRHSHIHACINSEIDVHINNSHESTWLHIHSEVNMLPSCTCLQIHSYTWTHRNTQKHINTDIWTGSIHSYTQIRSHTSTSYTFTQLNMLTDLLPFIDTLTHGQIHTNVLKLK